MSDKKYVVIWDTCTRPEYYQDLHNVMALPNGALVRYDYRKKYFDDGSRDLLVALSKGKIKKIPCLIFYGEMASHTQGKEPPKGSVVSYVVPYRIGEIVSASVGYGVVDDEDKYHYDIELGGYPDHQKFVARWEKNFVTTHTDKIPFQSWHTSGLDLQLWDDLVLNNGSSDDQNWRAIVEALRKLQFANDSFWRLVGPYKKDKIDKDLIQQVVEPNQKLRQYRLEVTDSTDFGFNISNNNPDEHPARPTRTLLNLKPGKILQCDKESIVLRTYGSTHLTCTGTASDFWKGDRSILSFKTVRKGTGSFPVGPDIEMPVLVKRSKIWTGIGVFCVTLSALLYLFTSKLKIYKSVNGADVIDSHSALTYGAIGLIAIVSALFGTYILRKELKSKS